MRQCTGRLRRKCRRTGHTVTCCILVTVPERTTTTSYPSSYKSTWLGATRWEERTKEKPPTAGTRRAHLQPPPRQRHRLNGCHCWAGHFSWTRSRLVLQDTYNRGNWAAQCRPRRCSPVAPPTPLLQRRPAKTTGKVNHDRPLCPERQDDWQSGKLGRRGLGLVTGTTNNTGPSSSFQLCPVSMAVGMLSKRVNPFWRIFWWIRQNKTQEDTKKPSGIS